MARALGAWTAVALAAALSAGAPAAAQGREPLFGGFQTSSDEPIEVEADSLEVTEADGTRKSEFSGHVVVRRGDTLIRAASLAIYSPVEGGAAANGGMLGQDSFDRIEASGAVTVNSGPQTATGDRAVVDMKARTIVLSGNVVLSDGSNVLSGDRLVVDLDTGEARVERSGDGRIRGVFTPNAARPQ